MYDSVLIIPRPPCCIELYTKFILIFKFPRTNEPILFLRVCIWVSLKVSTGAKTPICESSYVFAILIWPTIDSLNFAQNSDIPLIFTMSLLKLVSSKSKFSLMSKPKIVKFFTIEKPVSTIFSAKSGVTLIGKTWVFSTLIIRPDNLPKLSRIALTFPIFSGSQLTRMETSSANYCHRHENRSWRLGGQPWGLVLTSIAEVQELK